MEIGLKFSSYEYMKFDDRGMYIFKLGFISGRERQYDIGYYWVKDRLFKKEQSSEPNGCGYGDIDVFRVTDADITIDHENCIVKVRGIKEENMAPGYI